MRDDRGFTLIELLVVILIIGLLAAIALPSFLGQRQKGQDTDAKENAANATRFVQSCFIETQDYSDCETADLIAAGGTGLPLGSSQGQVDITSGGANEFTVIAYSRSGGEFHVAIDPATQIVERTCTGGTKGCTNSKW